MNEPKRIVITREQSFLRRDGVNTFIFELGSALVKKGCEVIFLSGCEVIKRKTFQERFDVDALPKFLTLKRKVFKNIIEEVITWLVKGSYILHKLKPDMVIMNGVMPCLFNFKRIIPICHGVRTTGKKYSAVHKLYNKIMYSLYGGLISVSEPLKQEMLREIKINSRVIPIGIDIRKYWSKPLEKREKAILHAGSRSVKNLPTTLRAFEKVLQQIPEAILYITGNIHYARAPSSYRHLPLRLRDNVRFLGYIPKKKLRELYSNVYAVSAPSLYEAFPYVTLESFASGTPVVGSGTIPRQLLIDTYNGFRISNPLDHKELADKLVTLIQDNSLWKSFSINAQQTAQKYDISQIAEAYLLMRRP